MIDEMMPVEDTRSFNEVLTQLRDLWGGMTPEQEGWTAENIKEGLTAITQYENVLKDPAVIDEQHENYAAMEKVRRYIAPSEKFLRILIDPSGQKQTPNEEYFKDSTVYSWKSLGSDPKTWASVVGHIIRTPVSTYETEKYLIERRKLPPSPKR